MGEPGATFHAFSVLQKVSMRSVWLAWLCRWSNTKMTANTHNNIIKLQKNRRNKRQNASSVFGESSHNSIFGHKNSRNISVLAVRIAEKKIEVSITIYTRGKSSIDFGAASSPVSTLFHSQHRSVHSSSSSSRFGNTKMIRNRQ